jgi:hypothetical protein
VSGFEIRIRGFMRAKMTHKIEVLDVLFLRLKASLVAWTSFEEA